MLFAGRDTGAVCMSCPHRKLRRDRRRQSRHTTLHHFQEALNLKVSPRFSETGFSPLTHHWAVEELLNSEAGQAEKGECKLGANPLNLEIICGEPPALNKLLVKPFVADFFVFFAWAVQQSNG